MSNEKVQLAAAFSMKYQNFLLGLNIQSLRFHQDSLLVELGNLKHQPRIIALTETWLTDNDSLDGYSVPGYHAIESKPRSTGRGRGGVAFYVHESASYKLLSFRTNIECLILEVNFGQKQFFNFCVIYRPP